MTTDESIALNNCATQPVHSDVEITVDGPPIAVRADVAPIVSLLLHELTSNAAKHGALSGNGQSLDVSWQVDAGGVSFVWKETLPTRLKPPKDRGFGLSLIERAIPYECGGRSNLIFEDYGLRIEFWLPAKSIQRLSDEQSKRADADKVLPGSSVDDLEMGVVMVEEDNMVLALEMEEFLADMGAKETESFATPEAAIESLERVEFSAAVWDKNLGNTDSFSLAVQLRQREIPFVIVSGCGSTPEAPPAVGGVPRITIPVDKAHLILALEIVIRTES